MKVSILILTLNEEKNLPACLDALTWCDDIVILDSGSSDRTTDIAAARGARVLHNAFQDFATQRNYGLDAGAFRHDWVLHLDADELVTEQLRDEIAGLAEPTDIDGFRLAAKTIFFGRWLKHAGMYPAYQVRLGHRERLRFVQVGHGQREACPPEHIGTLREPYLHFAFSHGLKQWLSRHVRYADAEARDVLSRRSEKSLNLPGVLAADRTERRRALKAVSQRLPLGVRPFARFFYVLVLRGGFRDGRLGILYALMLGTYEGMIAILAAERSMEAQKPSSNPT